MPFASGLPFTDSERPARKPPDRLGLSAKQRKAYEIEPTKESKARDQRIMGESDTDD